MKQILKSIFLFGLVFSFCTNAQSKIEEDIEAAYQNAKKGIYWSLENIPEKKTKVENDLIAENRLYASIKLEKEIGGIKIESTGFYHSNTLTIKLYKSYDSLIQEGYIKKIPSE